MSELPRAPATGPNPEPTVDDGGAWLPNLLGFVTLLRRAGIRVGSGQSLDFVRAVAWVELGNQRQLFHTARALLVSRSDDLALFGSLFERYFRWPHAPAPSPPRRAPRVPRHGPNRRRPFTLVDYLASKARQLEGEIDIVDRAATYSQQEALRRKEFSALDDDEVEVMRRLILDLRWRVAERRTRRRRPHRRGAELDPRATLRLAVRHGGVPVRLLRARRRVRPRPIVLLADISGSMEKLSRLILQFFYAASHGLGEVESFVFGTRLTRLTPDLRLRNLDRALDSASRRVADWSGGTRIGESLHSFHRRWGRRVLRRGAVVVVISDGWERGDADLLRREMAHLQRRCHRLIWLNPLAGHSDYAPTVEGMAAALPHVDDFLPVHDLQSLQQLAHHLATLSSRSAAIPRPAPFPLPGIRPTEFPRTHYE